MKWNGRAGAPQHPQASGASLAANLRTLRGVVSLLGAAARGALRKLVERLSWALARLKTLLIDGRQHLWGVDFRRWHGLLLLVAAYYAGRTLADVVRYIVTMPQRRVLARRLWSSSSYEEWRHAAQQWDAFNGAGPEPLQLSDDDAAQLESMTTALRVLRGSGDCEDLMSLLRLELRRTSCYRAFVSVLDTHVQYIPVPPILEEYLEEVQSALDFLAHEAELPLDHKISFFKELRHAYGRTALVLSGGGSFGFFHMGVIRALFTSNLLPRIVSGSSAGALSASLLTTRPENQIAALLDMIPGELDMNLLSNNSLLHIARHLITKGVAQDSVAFVTSLRRLYGDDTTFADAYAISGRILNVAVSAADTHEPPRVLNYLTAPDVLIWSAVACSSAFPLLFEPQPLLARGPDGTVVRLGLLDGGTNAGAGSSHAGVTDADGRRAVQAVVVGSSPGITPGSAGSQQPTAEAQRRRWRDGSLEADLPMRGVSEIFGVNNFLISQTNPYLLPILAAQRLLPRGLAIAMETEFKHRCMQLLAWFPRAAVLKLLAQPWRGDLTMIMPVTALGVGRAAQNLAAHEIAVAIQEGQLKTWRTLTAMRAACAVEMAIDAALEGLLVVSRAGGVVAPATGYGHRTVPGSSATSSFMSPRSRGLRPKRGMAMRPGLPSWLHMPALGMPPTASLESLRRTASADSWSVGPSVPATPRGGLSSGDLGALHTGEATTGGPALAAAVFGAASRASPAAELSQTAPRLQPLADDRECLLPMPGTGGADADLVVEEGGEQHLEAEDSDLAAAARNAWREMTLLASCASSEGLDFIAP